MSTLHPTPSHRNSQPVKLYEYLGAGLPVVASNFPEFSELLRGCGVQVDAQNVEEIRTAVRNLLLDNVALEKMSNTGRERILNSYCWDREADRLVQFCHKLSTPKRPSAEKSSVQIEK
jgi:glycosyltransferase involved in cell wall biosynthesis